MAGFAAPAGRCPPSHLKLAGFSAAEMVAGMAAASLVAAGFSAVELVEAMGLNKLGEVGTPFLI